MGNNSTPYSWFAISGYVGITNEHEFGYYTSFTAQGLSGLPIYRAIASMTSLTAATRIVVIPANDLRNGRKATVDFNDYNAVKAFYNLPH